MCQSTATLPLITRSVSVETQSCDYSSIPTASTIHPTSTLGPPVTDTKHCQVCTPTAFMQDSCSSLLGCVVQTGQVSVTAASSYLHVGQITSSVLYTSVSNALETICPTVSQTKSATNCDPSAAVKIEGIDWKDGDEELRNDGYVEIQVELSQYNLTSMRGVFRFRFLLLIRSPLQDRND